MAGLIEDEDEERSIAYSPQFRPGAYLLYGDSGRYSGILCVQQRQRECNRACAQKITPPYHYFHLLTRIGLFHAYQ